MTLAWIFFVLSHSLISSLVLTFDIHLSSVYGLFLTVLCDRLHSVKRNEVS